MLKALFLSIVLVIAHAAHGQSGPGQEQLILYKLDRPQGKYLLCRNYQSPKKKSISEVIISETFSIQLRSGLCCVTMSNVCVLQTKLDVSSARHETNTVEQHKMLFKTYGMAFPKQTKIVVNGCVTELLKAEVDGPTQGDLIYEGDAAIRKLKELGLEPPEDADVK